MSENSQAFDWVEDILRLDPELDELYRSSVDAYLTAWQPYFVGMRSSFNQTAKNTVVFYSGWKFLVWEAKRDKTRYIHTQYRARQKSRRRRRNAQ